MMSMPIEQPEAVALELPVRERARLAQRLIESLDKGADEDPAEVEHAWDEEIRRRLEEYRTGRTRAIPASDVFRQAQDRRM